MIRSYLHDVLTSIKRIEAYTIDGRDIFMSNPMIQDAVVRNFEIIGEAIKRVPKSVLSQQPQIPWQDVAGFRDVLIHDYYDVDLDEVWLTVERDLPTLREAVEILLLSSNE
ncbi:MAG: DUF86 domain-containing protein [Anaerolineae bacterium]|jgi:uncharacterized protein with HEPN domain